MTTTEMSTTDEILEAFASAGHVLPRAALEQAAARWDEVGPHLLDMLRSLAEGAELTERISNILFFGIYLMAQVRETRAFAPLCAVAAAIGDPMEQLIGDGVTEDLHGILARVYDGDPVPLRRLIEAEDADEFVRDSALNALAWLTATGRIDRAATAVYLRELFQTLQPREANQAWVGWQEAIAWLGLEELTPLVETAFRAEWIHPSVMSFHHFKGDLRAARQATDPTAAFAPRIRDIDSLADAAEHLSTWAAFQPDVSPRRRPAAPAMTPRDGATVHNPFRHVGRNDPCPCGSGKKFKKCCLGKESRDIS